MQLASIFLQLNAKKCRRHSTILQYYENDLTISGEWYIAQRFCNQNLVDGILLHKD